MSSACWMVGSEVATTWMSRIAMNIPRHIAAKPIQVASVGRGAALAGDAAARPAASARRTQPLDAKPEWKISRDRHVVRVDARRADDGAPFMRPERARDRELSVFAHDPVYAQQPREQRKAVVG